MKSYEFGKKLLKEVPFLTVHTCYSYFTKNPVIVVQALNSTIRVTGVGSQGYRQSGKQYWKELGNELVEDGMTDIAAKIPQLYFIPIAKELTELWEYTCIYWDITGTGPYKKR